MSPSSSKKVVVFDYGFGNVRSAERALARAGAEVEITRDYDKAMNADGLLVPGVGAFAACIKGLHEARGDWIIDRRLSGNRPISTDFTQVRATPSGTWFSDLQAVEHAWQPMQLPLSITNPKLGTWPFGRGVVIARPYPVRPPDGRRPA